MIDDFRSSSPDYINDPMYNNMPCNVMYDHDSDINKNSLNSHSHTSDLNSDLTILGIAIFFGVCIVWSMIF